MTRTERRKMRDACCDLFRTPTTEMLSNVLTLMLRQSAVRHPVVGLREFVADPTEEHLNDLEAIVPKECEPTIKPFVLLSRVFYQFKNDQSTEKINHLLSVLPPLRASDLNAVALVVFLSRPAFQHSLNVRLELTLKQRRKKRLITPRRPQQNLIVRIPRLHPAVTNIPKHTPRNTPEDTPHYTYYYLTEDEARSISVRVMNRLNGELFGRSARRKQNPRRLTALVCQHDKKHDKGTRRHLHLLLALPPDVTMRTFWDALTIAIRTEPFIYRRVTAPERVQNLAASILYNNDERKVLSQNPILYIHTQPENGEQPQ